MLYGGMRRKESRMNRDGRLELFKKNTGAAVDSCKKLKKYYLMEGFDGFNPLIDQDELNQIILMCFWELLQRYDENRNCSVSTFVYKYLPSHVKKHIQGHGRTKIINNKKVFIDGIKDDFGLSRYRKGKTHISIHSSKRKARNGGVFYTQLDFINNMIAIEPKLPELEENDIYQALDIIKSGWNKEVSEDYRICKLSTYDIICLRFGIGCDALPIKEITKKSGITNSGVRLRLKRGLKNLAEILDELKSEKKRRALCILYTKTT